MAEHHILIAVTRDPSTNARQTFQVGRAAKHETALNRFEGHADRQFYREATYSIAGLPVDHFAVRSTADDRDWRLQGMIPVRLRDMVKTERPAADHINRPLRGMGAADRRNR